MTETGLFAGADITNELLIRSSRFPDDKSSELCVWISFWVLYKEESVHAAVPMIGKPGISMSCEMIWISHSGNTEVGAHPKETVGCVEGSVNKGV